MRYSNAALFVLMSLSTIAVGHSTTDCFSDKNDLRNAINSAVEGGASSGAGYENETYGPIENWCFEASLQDFSNLFSSTFSFNADISGWNVSSVTDMSFMFNGAAAFNQDIGGWNVSSVENMSYMFEQAAAFNQDIGGWNVSSVTSMSYMFAHAAAFNQDIGGWNVSSVTSMSYMFDSAATFNQDLCNWGPKLFDGEAPIGLHVFRDSGCPNTENPVAGSSPDDLPQNLCSLECLPSPTTNSGGDPHFIGFNQKLVTFQGECTLVLLDSPTASSFGDDVTLHVRTTRKLDFSYISGVAMKIGDEVVEVKPDSSFFLNGNHISEQSTLSGLPFILKKETKGTKKMIVSYSFDLGHGRMIDIRANKRSNMMFVSTKGHFPEATQGMLGSPGKEEFVSRDGRNLSDIDVNVYGESWQVKDDDLILFMEPIGPQYPQKCLYEEAPGATSQLRGRRRLMEKKVIELEEARAVCSQVTRAVKRELCIQDTIAMGDLEIKDDPFYLE